jgi:hypothetical protein
VVLTVVKANKGQFEATEEQFEANEGQFEAPINFVEPDLCQEFPFLEPYCAIKTLGNNYHCKNLQRILFRAANSEYNGDKLFDFVTNDLFGTNSEKGLDRDISYHIKHIMEYREKPSTIYNSIKAFKEKCDLLKNSKDNQTF